MNCLMFVFSKMLYKWNLQNPTVRIIEIQCEVGPIRCLINLRKPYWVHLTWPQVHLLYNILSFFHYLPIRHQNFLLFKVNMLMEMRRRRWIYSEMNSQVSRSYVPLLLREYLLCSFNNSKSSLYIYIPFQLEEEAVTNKVPLAWAKNYALNSNQKNNV